VSGKEYQISGHMNGKHKLMMKDIIRLGWFWGTIHTMMKFKPKATITHASSAGDFWECIACPTSGVAQRAMREAAPHARDMSKARQL
jgi:hypothetical protein